jgi:C-terminal peptidase prc
MQRIEPSLETTIALRPMTAVGPRQRLVLLATLCCIFAVGACKRSEPEVKAAAHAAPKAARTPATVAQADAGDKHPGGPSAAPSPEPNSDHAANDVTDDDDEEDVDYWKNVQFDVHNFDEVLDYVQTYYIDASPDRKRAWIEAANFALMSLDPSTELLPVSFYKARQGNPDEEGRLDGKTEPFLCRGQVVPDVVLHHLPTDDYLKEHRKVRKKGRLSNEEVMVLRDKQKQRSLVYNDAWKPMAFARPQFECAMTYVQQQVSAWHLAQKAKPKDAAKKAEVKKDERKDDAAKAAAPDEKGGPGTVEGRGAPQARPSLPTTETGKAAAQGDPAAKKEQAGKVAAGKDKDDDNKRPPPDMNRAWVAAASGYLYALDPHSSVIPRKAWDDSTDKTQDNSFEGIGAVLSQRDDLTIVENPMEGRPAWRAGVRAGDVIHKVDGIDVSGWMLSKVVKLIRGKRDTKVVLTVSSENDPAPKEVGIVREHIEIKNVDGELIKDFPGVAHVKMAGFVPQSTNDLRKKIEELEKKAPGGKLTGLILDLRGNSGGLLNQAIDVADLFIPAGKRIVTVKSRRRPEEIHEAKSTATDYQFPVVVLVNDGSASASEIVASALQDNERGLVVGLRTFGKASVQTLFEPALHQDYYIKLTVARYYAPDGQTIQVVGVTPDATVAPDVDGKVPVGFREENLNNHLVPIESAIHSPWTVQMPALNKCVQDSGTGEKVAKREPKPQIHPDFQLLRAADYVVCLARHPQAAAR